jgi:hypothetical protein
MVVIMLPLGLKEDRWSRLKEDLWSRHGAFVRIGDVSVGDGVGTGLGLVGWKGGSPPPRDAGPHGASLSWGIGRVREDTLRINAGYKEYPRGDYKENSEGVRYESGALMRLAEGESRVLLLPEKGAPRYAVIFFVTSCPPGPNSGIAEFGTSGVRGNEETVGDSALPKSGENPGTVY